MALRDKLEALEPRERQLMLIFGGIVVMVVLLLVPITAYSAVGDLRDENRSLHDVIRRIHRDSNQIATRRAENQVVLEKYERPAPALAGYLSGLAKANEIEIPELKDRAPVPHGKKYEELSTEVSLKKVGMLQLLKFLEQIAQASHPVNVTRLSIRKRGSEPDSYDVSLTVSAYHRSAKESRKPAKPRKDDEETAEPAREE